MSDRFYTTLTVSGPDAVTAKKVAIQALKDLSKDDEAPRWSGFWYDEETIDEWEKGARDGSKITHEEAEEYRRKFRDGEEAPHFFDHDSGQSAIFPLIDVATKFSTEKFVLWVNGSYGEGVQGNFTIADGGQTLVDGRSEEVSYGEYRPQDISLELAATGELREIGRENKILWWFREMRYRFRSGFHTTIYRFPWLAEMIYGPRLTPTHVAPVVRDMTEEERRGEEISMEEVLGAGTHKRPKNTE